MENYPKDTFSPRRACLASCVALRKAQWILASDESKTLHSWEIHLYRRTIIGHEQFKTGINSCASSVSSTAREMVVLGIQGTGISKMNVQNTLAGRTQRRTLAAWAG